MRRIGIMGGTFDPIHYGHLVTAEEAYFRFSLDKVVFVPSAHPPHKLDKDISSAAHRYTMTALATASNSHFQVSAVEMNRPGPSYTIDTVRSFQEEYGDGTQLYFITGADAILQIFEWKDAHSLLNSCEFIAATRPGYVLPTDRIEETFGEHSARIHPIEVPSLAISSTNIRWRIRRGIPVRYQLPDDVIRYIEDNDLYIDH